MTALTAPRSWRLTPFQIGLGAAWVIFIIATEVVIVLTYFASQASTNTFNQDSDITADLANIQRHTLLLQIETNKLLDNPQLGLDIIQTQRASLSSQLKVLTAQAAGKTEILSAAQAIQDTIQEYDRLIAQLGENPSPTELAAAQSNFDALFVRLDRELIKPSYDRAENDFYQGLSKSLQAQEQAQLLLIGIGALFFVSSGALVFSLIRASRSAFESAQQQVDILEKTVAERTKSLAIAGEISRRLSSIMNKRQLAVEVVEQLKQAFNYYHAHIYLLDESGENLVMAGGTGEAGQTLLEQNHKIPAGKGLVGRSAESKEVVLVPDTRLDTNWLPNPLLPDTKSEIAVPILAGERTLGVLDVQNDVAGSLGQQDADLLRIIADQTAIALENIRASETVQAAAQEVRQLVDYAPDAIAFINLENGFFIDPNENTTRLFGLSREELHNKVGPGQLSPATQPDGRSSLEKAREKVAEALEKGITIFEWVHRNAQGKDFLAEIRLVRVATATGMSQRVHASITDITERKRLEAFMSKRAAQQEALNQITQKIQSTTTIPDALQIAARELGTALGKKPTLVSLMPDNLKSETSEERVK